LYLQRGVILHYTIVLKLWNNEVVLKLFFTVLIAGFIFSACANQGSWSSGDSNSNNPTSGEAGVGGATGTAGTTGTTGTAAEQGGAPKAEEKRGDTVKSGVITSAGSSFFIKTAAGQPELIESYAYDLADYVGQNVTVTGQYSGDTLFVGKIE
jgi:hypothetical protein